MDQLQETIEFFGEQYSIDDFNTIISNLVVNEDFLSVLTHSIESDNPWNRVNPSVKFFFVNGERKIRDRGFGLHQMRELLATSYNF